MSNELHVFITATALHTRHIRNANIDIKGIKSISIMYNDELHQFPYKTIQLLINVAFAKQSCNHVCR